VFMHQLPHLATPFPYTTLFRSPTSGNMSTQQIHRRIELRHALMRSIIAVGMVNGRQHPVFGADRFYIGAGIGGEPHDMQGLVIRSEEHTSELQSRENLVCRLPL